MMRDHVEKMIAEYPKMLSTRTFLKKQIEGYRPVSVEDVIDSMTFSQPDGDRVQTGGTSDKTCTVALVFRDRVNRLNEEVIGQWVKEYDHLDAEIRFLERCIGDLPGDLYDVMSMLVLDGASWDEAQALLCMGRNSIAQRRKEAISLMTIQYQRRASEIEAVMLS